VPFAGNRCHGRPTCRCVWTSIVSRQLDSVHDIVRRHPTPAPPQELGRGFRAPGPALRAPLQVLERGQPGASRAG
jgi:hypothetical protein